MTVDISGNTATFSGFKTETLRQIDVINAALSSNGILHVIIAGYGIIGDKAFYNERNLKSITIPDSVTAIGQYAFESASALTTITIPAGVTSIGAYAFVRASTLKSITIPDGVTKIEDNTFRGAIALQSINIPDSVTTIGEYAFDGATSLKSITIPVGVTSIGAYAFTGATALTTITIPAGVTSIGAYTFFGTTALKSITIPAGVTNIETGAFRGATALASVTFETGSKLIAIGSNAFRDARALTAITIPASVTSIATSAFVNSGLRTVYINIPNGLNLTPGADKSFYGANGVKFILSVSKLDNILTFSGCGILTKSVVDADILQGITQVIINGYDGIGAYAFAGATALQSITIPASVAGIREYAFQTTTVLTSVTFEAESKLSIIGDNAFAGATALQSITIPANVDGIGEDAFADTRALTSVTFESGSNLLTIEPNAFRGASALDSVTFGAGSKLSSIGDYAFQTNTALTVVTFGAGSQISTIGQYAFYGATALQSITIPASVAGIGTNAFFKSGLKTVYVNIGNKLITLYGPGMPFNGATGVNIIPSVIISDNKVTFGGGGTLTKSVVDAVNLTAITTQVIINGYAVIGEHAFDAVEFVESIYIPASVTSIGEYAFYNATGLTSVSFGARSLLTTIGVYAFRRTSSLKSITIPDSVTNIAPDAFYNSELTTVYINCSNGLGKSHGQTPSFYGTSNSVIIQSPPTIIMGDTIIFIGTGANTLARLEVNSANLSSSDILHVIIVGYGIIGANAFDAVEFVESIYIPASVTAIGEYAFSGATSLKSITIPDSVTAIGDNAFHDATALTSVTFGTGSKLKTIGQYAFQGASKMTAITIPDSVTTIGQYAFQGAIALQSITIPASVTRIEDFTFQGMTALTSVTFEGSVLTIGQYAFQGASALTTITIPASVTAIGQYAFQGASKMTAITIPDSVTTIGQYAFQGAIALQSITIPASVTRIEDFTFQGMTALTSVTFEGSVLTIGQYAFQGASALTTITIPASVTAIGDNAFLNSGLITVYINSTNSLITSYGTGMSFKGANGVNIQSPTGPGNTVSSSFKVDLPMLGAAAYSTEQATIAVYYTFDNGSADAQLYTSIAVAYMQSVFKFSSDSELNNDIYLDANDPVKVYACANLFKPDTSYQLSLSVVPNDAGSTNSSNLFDLATSNNSSRGLAVQTFLQKVAECVIGSKLATDMLLNESAITVGYTDAIKACIDVVNSKFAPGSGDAAAAAARRIYNAMTYDQSSRFGLKYKAVIGTTHPSDGTYVCTTSSTPAAAVVAVQIATSGVSNMTLTTQGSGFAIGQNIDLTNSSGVVIASIIGINSVQVAMLNGTLDAKTPMPFEAGDMFTVMFTIGTHQDQVNVSKDRVSTSTVTQVIIKVV